MTDIKSFRKQLTHSRKERRKFLNKKHYKCYILKWRKENYWKLCKNLKDWQMKNKERFAQDSRKNSLRNNYSLSIDGYNSILEKQNDRCAICKSLPGKKRLAVNHDHITDKVRGLLCSLCNTGLGFFKDSPELLNNAIKYLKRKRVHN